MHSVSSFIKTHLQQGLDVHFGQPAVLQATVIDAKVRILQVHSLSSFIKPHLQQGLDVHFGQPAVPQAEVDDAKIQILQELVQTVLQVAGGQVELAQAGQASEGLGKLV